MTFYLVIESPSGHMFVNLISGVSFPETKAPEVLFQRLLDHRLQRLVVLACLTRRRVVGRENSGNYKK